MERANIAFSSQMSTLTPNPRAFSFVGAKLHLWGDGGIGSVFLNKRILLLEKNHPITAVPFLGRAVKLLEL
jgi:hypothetical protein